MIERDLELTLHDLAEAMSGIGACGRARRCPARPTLDTPSAVLDAASPKWRFQSMFSATKFVVAGAIVALFGGFLLAGVLTQPSDETVPER